MLYQPLSNWLFIALTILTAAVSAATSAAAAPQTAQAEVLAVSGVPYGVARIRYPIPPTANSDSHDGLIHPRISSPQTSVFYPAYSEITAKVDVQQALQGRERPRLGRGRLLGRIADLVREATGETEQPQVVGTEVWFLFKGDKPFTLDVDGLSNLRMTITPTPDSQDRIYRATLAGWWQAYTANAAQRIESGDYPPIIENYLIGMLSRRFDLPIPEDLQAKPDPEKTSIVTVLQQVAGAEAMRNRAIARVAQGDTERFSNTELSLPAEPLWSDTPIDPIDQQVAIEDLANRVPLNSLYIRFGSFKNYLWFRDLGNQHGGDITRMVTLRGFDYQATKRIETQLNVQATDLSLMLGGTVVEDMAIVGHDLFLTEGASIGVLMQAKNAFLLSTSLKSERNATATKVPDASQRDVQIAGKTVNLLSTPDNRIRSYLAMDGSFALVSNSETLIREFLETGTGAVTLADSDAFRYARSLMQEENDYKIFAYFSDEFFQNLVGPAYQIELRRRLNATADIELIQLARLAATSEGKRYTELEELIAEGYLPDGIGQRPDGSGPILAADQILDSRRGKRGYFLPISDVQVTAVTREEAAWYKKQADFYADNWREMDPVVAGIRSIESPNEGYQRLEIHAEIAPLVPKKYGWIAEQLGPPTTETIRFGADDIAAVQAYVVSEELGGSIPPHHLFVGIKDAMLPDPAELEGLLDGYRALKSLSGYLGAWPQPGLLDRLPLGLGRGRPVGPGMTKLLVGLYRFQGNGFSLISFMPEIILDTLPNLSVAEAAEPAQVRFHVDSLEGTRVETWANQQLYQRSFDASLAGVQLLQSLTAQLNVQPESAKDVAEQLLDARLQCPLGGTYVFQSNGDGATSGPEPALRRTARAFGSEAEWTSTAWKESGGNLGAMPADFQAPMLKWFRGASGRLTQYESRLVADLILDMKDGL